MPKKKKFEYNLWAYKGKLGKDAHEVKLALSDADHKLYGTVAKEVYDEGPISVVVTDLNTGIKWRLKKADCGAGCKCACEATPFGSLEEEFVLVGPKWAVDEIHKTIMGLPKTSEVIAGHAKSAWSCIKLVAQE